MERGVIPTLEECQEVYERKGQVVIINDGTVIDIVKEGEE